MDMVLKRVFRSSNKKLVEKYINPDFEGNYMLLRGAKDNLIENKNFFVIDHSAAYKMNKAGKKVDFKRSEPLLSSNLLQHHYEKYFLKDLKAYAQVYQEVAALGNGADNKTLDKADWYSGAVYNHLIYMDSLAAPVPNQTTPKYSYEMYRLIMNDFGNFDAFLEEFRSTALNIKGYGWAWLGYDMSSNQLSVAATRDEKSLEPETGLVPLLGVDMWEHAFYHQFKNAKADYLKAVLSCLNWEGANEKLAGLQQEALALHKGLDEDNH